MKRPLEMAAEATSRNKGNVSAVRVKPKLHVRRGLGATQDHEGTGHRQQEFRQRQRTSDRSSTRWGWEFGGARWTPASGSSPLPRAQSRWRRDVLPRAGSQGQALWRVPTLILCSTCHLGVTSLLQVSPGCEDTYQQCPWGSAFAPEPARGPAGSRVLWWGAPCSLRAGRGRVCVRAEASKHDSRTGCERRRNEAGRPRPGGGSCFSPAGMGGRGRGVHIGVLMPVCLGEGEGSARVRGSPPTPAQSVH